MLRDFNAKFSALERRRPAAVATCLALIATTAGVVTAVLMGGVNWISAIVFFVVYAPVSFIGMRWRQRRGGI